MNEYKRITLISIASRIFVLLIGKASSTFMERFDKSYTLESQKSIFDFLCSWDAIHFLNITLRGYYYEHAIPFFPLLPLITRTLTNIISYATRLNVNHFTVGVIFNNLLFIISSLLMYKISKMTFDSNISYLSTLLFIFNPASVIFSTLYSEGLFCLLFLMGYFYILKRRFFKASLILSLTTLCRSNGILFVLFFKSIYFPILLLPFLLFQGYTFLLIFRTTSSFKPFLPYSMVQKVYWNQGFLKFLINPMLMNILVGAPFIIYCALIITQYFKSRKSSQPFPINDTRKAVVEVAQEKKSTIRTAFSWIMDPLFSDYLSNHSKLVAILSIQVFMLVFLIHWNIAMRFISFNPFIYWSGAYFFIKHNKSNLFRSVFILFYTFGVIYIILFSCFYPPA